MASTRTIAAACAQHAALQAWLDRYDRLHIDIGTGDGAFALRLARETPSTAVLGVDTCLDNLAKPVRKGPDNLRLLACDATSPPAWLRYRADALSINFPYGSLFHAVVGGDPSALAAVLSLARPGARIEIRVNASAGAAYGIPAEAIREGLTAAIAGLAPREASVTVVPHDQMSVFPSTWAKRLAYGRPSEVVVATAMLDS